MEHRVRDYRQETYANIGERAPDSKRQINKVQDVLRGGSRALHVRQPYAGVPVLMYLGDNFLKWTLR